MILGEGKNSHPLRPKEGYILVCEGQSDAQFIHSIWRGIPQVTIYHANGHDAVQMLAKILEPSVYILDRDFDKSFEEAKATLQPGKPYTCWPRHDIEGYLLYPDWFMEYMNQVKNSSDAKFSIRSSPQNEEIIANDIKAVAENLVADHAGLKTLKALNHYIGPSFQFSAKLVKGKIKRGAEASTRDDWEQFLIEEVERLGSVAKDFDAKISTFSLLDTYHQHLAYYGEWAKELPTIQNHFSGKRIFQSLTLKWRHSSSPDSSRDPWQLLRDNMISVASNYSLGLQGQLSDDSYLGDFGRLAKKITGQDLNFTQL